MALSVKTKTRILVSLFLVILVPSVMMQLISSMRVVRNFEEAVDLSKSLSDYSPNPVTQEIKHRFAESNREVLRVNVISFGVGILGILLAVGFASLFHRSIVKPIHILKQGIDDIVEGDLDHQIQLNSHDEFSMLADAYNHMTQQLKENKQKLNETNTQLLAANRYLESHQKELEQSNQQLQLEVMTRKTAEQTLEAAVQHLKIANRDLEDFAFITAHDLKTPLRGICALSDMLKEDYAEQLDEHGRQMLDMMTQRTQRMHDLVGGILTYAKVTNTNDMTYRNVCTQDVVMQAIDQVGIPAHIEIDIDDELPNVVCDETQLIQVFLNLVDNAVKYMDKPEGRISIKGELLNDYWTFSVADNGPGIAASHREKIFKIFQTLMTKDEFNTTGIGLSLIRKIVEQYGGQTWVESELGQGSTFFFTLKHQTIPQQLKMI